MDHFDLLSLAQHNSRFMQPFSTIAERLAAIKSVRESPESLVSMDVAVEVAKPNA